MKQDGGLAAKLANTPDTSNMNIPLLTQIQKDVALKKLVESDKPLEDSSADLLPVGKVGAVAANTIDKTLVTAANKVPVYMYDPDTYKGLAKGVMGKEPVNVSSIEAWSKANPNASDMEHVQRFWYDKLPQKQGYFQPSTLQVAAKSDSALLHELQHADDYLHGKPAGSSPNAMKELVQDVGRNQYSEEGLNKIGWKLYHGNLGERNANRASVDKYFSNSTPEIPNVRTLKDAEENAKLVDNVQYTTEASRRGVANTITADGLANKRAILSYSPYYSNLRPYRGKNGDLGEKILGTAGISTATVPYQEDGANTLKNVAKNIKNWANSPSDSYDEFGDEIK